MLHLEVNFRKGRANQGKSSWCVDTRSILSDGKEKFFLTKEAAQQYCKRVSEELVLSDTDAWTWTFADLQDNFLGQVKKERRAGERSQSYLNDKTRHVGQFIGLTLKGNPLSKFRVLDLTLGHIELQLMDELKLGKSKKTMENLFGSVNKMMKFAIKHGCRVTNPCIGVEIKFDLAKPKKKTNPANIQPEVIQKIITEMNPRWRLITSFAANSGLRQGELRALTWGDIYWSTNKINVDKAYKHQSKEVGVTKTEAGVRKVPLAKALKKAMQEYYIAQGRPSDSALVFQHEVSMPKKFIGGNQHARYTINPKKIAFSKNAGQPYSIGAGSALTHAHFLKAVHTACDDAGVDRITWHDLRHFSASMLLKKHSNSLWEVSKRLGHAQKSTTENIYGHFIEDVTDDEEEDLLALG